MTVQKKYITQLTLTLHGQLFKSSVSEFVIVPVPNRNDRELVLLQKEKRF